MPKRSIFLFLVIFFGGFCCARADEATKNAKIEEMLAAADIDQVQKQMLSMVSNQMKSGAFQKIFGGSLTPDQQKLANEFQDKVMQLVSRMVSWDQLKPTYVKLYAQAFSEGEIDSMLAFYKSPAGRAMVAKTPELMSQANQIVQQRMVSMQPEMQALMKEYVDKIKATAPASKQ